MPQVRSGDRRSRDTGATAVEYAIVASLIAAVIVFVVRILGGSVLGLFASIPSF